MLLEVDFWHLLSIGFTILGAIWGILKLGLRQFDIRLRDRFSEQDKRLANLGTLLQNEASEWKRLERDLMALKADLPIQYVRREDYVRGQSVLEAKMDSLNARIETLIVKGIRT